jgi:hypothetical protein
VSDRALLGLAQLQRLLSSVHGVSAEPVVEFLVAEGTSPESLLISEDGEQLRVGLFLDDSVLAQLSRAAHEPWTHERLSGFCAAAEGVSHFLYISHRAGEGRQVSHLELEAQAELDKYLAVLLQLWATGRRSASPALRHRLFERWELRPTLSATERDRYRLASALAAAYARALEARYVVAGRLEALLRDVRRLYRLSGGEKFSALAQGAVAWAA